MENVTLSAVPVLLLMCTISASNGVRADDSNFTVDSGNQESTYVKKRPKFTTIYPRRFFQLNYVSRYFDNNK